MSISIPFNNDNVSITLNIETKRFYDDVSNEDVVKYLKGMYTNKTRFKSRFVDKFLAVKNTPSYFPNFPEGFFDTQNEDTYYEFVKWIDYSKMTRKEIKDYHTKMETEYGITYDENDTSVFECDEVMAELLDLYDKVSSFEYSEAFKIENEEFRSKVFGSIDIVDMIKNLGHTRISTEGKRVSHKDYSHEGEYLGIKEYDVIYETHEVDCTKLGLDESAYALRCWCTSTEKEHWLWIEDEFKDNPLEAVASTMRIHTNVIPHITEIKRQGDVLLVETDTDITPEGEIVPLTADQYFGFLTAQS